MAFDVEASEHSKQDDVAIVEFSEELPFASANTHKIERNNFPVPEVVMSPSCPVPDVAPQDPVQLIKNFL